MSGLLSRLERSGLERRPDELTDGDISTGSTGFWTVVRSVQTRILREHADLLTKARLDAARRNHLKGVILRILAEQGLFVQRMTREALAESVASEIIGYGPLDPLLGDTDVTDILVNGPGEVFIEKKGRLELTPVAFRNEEHLNDIIGRIIGPLGRRVDQSSPFVDARLPDGSRVNVVVPPVVLGGPTLCIRKFSPRPWSLAEMVQVGTLSEELAQYLRLCVRARFNLIIAGGTGSGKTTLLNTLANCLAADDERIVTVEDSAEIHLTGGHVVSLEARPPSIEGKGEVTIRQLVRNSLRMRPDRLIIGEVRGAEAFELLNALNTGHEGSLSTLHANSGPDALNRLENMVLMAGEPLPHEVVREQVNRAVDMIVMMSRFASGSRKVTSVGLVHKGGTIGSSGGRVIPIFRWDPGDHARPEQSVRCSECAPAEVLVQRAQRAGLDGDDLAVLGWRGGI